MFSIATMRLVHDLVCHDICSFVRISSERKAFEMVYVSLRFSRRYETKKKAKCSL